MRLQFAALVTERGHPEQPTPASAGPRRSRGFSGKCAFCFSRARYVLTRVACQHGKTDLMKTAPRCYDGGVPSLTRPLRRSGRTVLLPVAWAFATKMRVLLADRGEAQQRWEYASYTSTSVGATHFDLWSMGVGKGFSGSTLGELYRKIGGENPGDRDGDIPTVEFLNFVGRQG